MRVSLTICALIAASAAWAGCVSHADRNVANAGDGASAIVERIVVAMGTNLHVQVTAASRAQALLASEAGLQAMEVVNARLSTWRDDSELAQLNRLRVGSYMKLSGPLLEDLRKARWWQRATGGAFDPAVGALVDLYQLRDGGRWPTDQEVWACMPHCGLDQLQVVYGSAGRLSAKLRLEEGGFGKGAGLDAAARAMLATGATAVAMDFGGQVLRAGARDAAGDDAAGHDAAGDDAAGHDAAGHYDIADPNERLRGVLRIRIDVGSLATTANSERRIRVGDRDLGHILDPRSGRPAKDFGSITVWARDAFAADCLSTGLFVMGPDAALAFAEKQEGIEVLALVASGDDDNPQLTARMTSGMRDRVTALVPDITFL
ncbi:MAG: thiamine biosynthesis lipoprotein [Neolewinella sp.]|jgi:thiamine biosynthesis lipoprotein